MKNDWTADLDILDLEELLAEDPQEQEPAPVLKGSNTRPMSEVRRQAERASSAAGKDVVPAVSRRDAAENGPADRRRRGTPAPEEPAQDSTDAGGPIPGVETVSLTASLNEAIARSSTTEGEGYVSSMSAPDRAGENAAAGRRHRSDVPEADGNVPPERDDAAAREREASSAAPRKSYRERMLEEDDSFLEYSEEGESYFTEEAASGRRRAKGTGSSGRGAKRQPAGSGADGRQGRGSSGAGRRGRGHEYEEDAGSRRGIPVHLILPAVIVLVLVVAIVRLVIWNQGVTIDTTTSDNSFNVEVNDNMVVLSSEELEGAADDGVTTVLCLGNEPFSADTSSSGLAGQIAELGDVEVINAAFPDSQVTCENATYSTDSLEDMDDIFNLFYVAYAISIDDYTSLATVASAHSDETYANAVEALQSTDFSAVDIIAIQYDGIDYINGMAMYNEDVPTELTTYVGALTNAITLLREAYPHIRIVFMSPWYAEYDGVSSRTTDLGNGTIVNYFQWAYDTCGSEGISFLDNYYGSINENNFEEYLSDGVNLNAAGCTKIADHFVYKVIQGTYAEYNVEALAVAD